jgi:hypothetical protein
MLVSSSVARRRGHGSSSGVWGCDKSEATRICTIRILVLARAPTPVQTNGVVACLARLHAVLTSGLLLAAFHLTRFAWPAPCATTLFGLSSALLLGSRHPCCARTGCFQALYVIPGVVSRFVGSSFALRLWCPVSFDTSPGPACARYDRIASAKSISPSSLISVSRARLLIVGQGRLSEANGAERLWRCCGGQSVRDCDGPV